MITINEIKNAEFTRGVRGYREDEVDQFLNRIILDMQSLMDERDSLLREIENMKEAAARKSEGEETVFQTLQAAKSLMDDISESAEKRASILIKNAELNAETIQREAMENVEILTAQAGRLKTSIASLRTRYISMLESEINRLDSASSQLLYDINGLMGSSLENVNAGTGASADTVRISTTDTIGMEWAGELKSELQNTEKDKAAMYSRATTVFRRNDGGFQEVKSLDDLIK